MTTDSRFILAKKTDFNTILACLGGKVYRWWCGGEGGYKIFVAEIGGGVAILLTPTFCKFWDPPPSEENENPLVQSTKIGQFVCVK